MIKIIDWKQETSNSAYDEKVGIKIAKLSGDEKFSTFITIIDPTKSVNPHYHKCGNEHYHIISGSGELVLTDIKNKISKTYKIKSSQSFTVPENVIHQLINCGDEPLVLMFSCPATHLASDRYFDNED